MIYRLLRRVDELQQVNGDSLTALHDYAPPGILRQARPGREVVAVPVSSLAPGDSPRLVGQDEAHVMRLAEVETPLPPILVDRRTMRVIDGMHRLMAAILKGQQTIDVELFEGPMADTFLLAVQANVSHGFPLSRADRHAAAARIVETHPHLSDRAIAEIAGLGARAVAEIRQRSSDVAPQLNARVGKDGKIRPLNGAEGRRRAADAMAERPEASLREVARIAGVSLATASDVRKRLARGEGPVPTRPAERHPGDRGMSAAQRMRRRTRGTQIDPTPVLQKLLHDPALRHNEGGRNLLRLLRNNALEPQEWSALLAAVPPHCGVLIKQLARQYAETWREFARELEESVS
jgi:ParB-like chromosome segregation protein Spo0J